MRGNLVTVAMQGDFGKPRPALVIQADLFDPHATLTILPITSILIDAPLFRVSIEPTAANGLRAPSQVMVDKAMTVKREKIDQGLGCIDAQGLLQVDRCLAVFLGIAR